MLSLAIWPLAACEQPPVDTTIDAPAATTSIDAGPNAADAEVPPEFDNPEPSETAYPPPEVSDTPLKVDSRRSARESPDERRQSSEAAQEPRGGRTGIEVENRNPERTGPSIVTPPSWVRRPMGDFPSRAMGRDIESGTVVLNCAIEPNGSVSDCQIVSEYPEDAGFGSAALAGTRAARMNPRQVDGTAVRSRMQFTMNFRLE